MKIKMPDQGTLAPRMWLICLFAATVFIAAALYVAVRMGDWRETPTRDQLPFLTIILRIPNVKIQAEAAIALGRLGANASRAIPLLERTAESRDEWLRTQSVFALKRIGDRALPALVRLVHSSQADVRRSAISSIESYYAWKGLDERCGDSSKSLTIAWDPAAVSALAALVRSEPDAVTRLRAAEALARAIPADANAIQVFVAAFKDKRLRLVSRMEAAGALARSGPFAEVAIPDLIRAIKEEEDYGLRYSAINALGSVDSNAHKSESLLLEMASNTRGGLRAAALCALSKLRPIHHHVILALSQGLRDSDQDVRKTAAESLSDIGQKAAPAIPALAEALRDESESVSEHAAIALSKAGGLGAELFRDYELDKKSRLRIKFKDTARKGKRFSKALNGQYCFVLEPIDAGWMIGINAAGNSRPKIIRVTSYTVPDRDAARITPAFITGYHWPRNSSQERSFKLTRPVAYYRHLFFRDSSKSGQTWVGRGFFQIESAQTANQETSEVLEQMVFEVDINLGRY